MKRELRIVKTDEVVGELVVDRNGTPHFRGRAQNVLPALRRRTSDAEVARDLMAGGWSNGYVYFAEPTP